MPQTAEEVQHLHNAATSLVHHNLNFYSSFYSINNPGFAQPGSVKIPISLPLSVVGLLAIPILNRYGCAKAFQPVQYCVWKISGPYIVTSVRAKVSAWSDFRPLWKKATHTSEDQICTRKKCNVFVLLFANAAYLQRLIGCCHQSIECGLTPLAAFQYCDSGWRPEH